MDNNAIRALIIEDDADEAGIIESYLAGPAGGATPFVLTRAPRLSTAYHLLERQEFDIVLIDLVLPQSVGLEGFSKIREMKPSMPVIVLTGLQDEPLAIEAVKLGGQDYLIKGSPDCCQLKRCIRYAIEKKRLSNIIEELLAADQSPKQAPEKGKPEARPLEAKDNFVGRISHELRNTLATAMIATNSLRGDGAEPLTPRQSRIVSIIARSVDRQARIVENLLELTQVQSGKFMIRFRRTDAAEVVRETAQEFMLACPDQDLQVDIDPDLPMIEGDPDLIAQVLRNLIANALGFAKKRVAVTAAKANPEGVLISIVDDGPGIPADRLGKLFIEFSHLEEPKSDGRYRKGLGLGLAICKEIVTGHNGKIWAESVPGQGAQFQFLLPVNEELKKIVGIRDRVLSGSDSLTND